MHDFNGGIAPSGLFWTIRVPDHALTIGAGTARLTLPRVHVVDSRVFLGPVDFPGQVSIDVTWTAIGPPVTHLPGSTNPTDPTSWFGTMSVASAVGSFSGGTNKGFGFTANGQTTAMRWAELGTEKNGVFLP